MVDLVTRAQWGARRPKGGYSPLRSTRGVKVHYTGGRVDPGVVDDHNKCVALVKSIQNHHMDGNQWMDIGYSLCCCPHRRVFMGRGPGHLPAANGPGLNSGHYAVLALVGNAGLVQPPDGMLWGILDAIDYLRAKGGAGSEIKGHRDGYPTDCPGDPIATWIRRGAPRPGGSTTPPPAGNTTKPGVKAPAWPGRLLAYPPLTSGSDVYTWQARMRERGWAVDVDGKYGPQSRSVCVAFQRDSTAHGWQLAADGIVGPLTWKAAFERPIT